MVGLDNKFFMGLLTTALIILGVWQLGPLVFGGGHHGPHKEHESLTKWAAYSFKGYHPEIAEVSGPGGAPEEIYDLGALLASADIAKGERTFKGKCASCHSIEEGGSNGTGPNLYDTLFAAKGSHAGFAYSGALDATEGVWDYYRMDAWLENPSKYARGTSMAFAGLKRDQERANVIAYLTSYTPNAEAFPAPLPAEGEGEAVAEDVVETVEPAPVSPDVALATDISAGFPALGFDWMGLNIAGQVATLTGTAPTADAKSEAFTAGETAIEANPVAAEQISLVVDGISVEGGEAGVGAALASIGKGSTLEACQAAFTATMAGRNIEFETGSAAISATSARLLDALSGAALLCGDFDIEIGGHTDVRGGAEGNQALSQSRADAVRTYLVGKGVSEVALAAVGYGETTPLDTADTDEAHAKNRRTEFTLSTREG